MVRESNFNAPLQNKACVCISSALYDRRAIDAPSPSLPLINSLTHLSYLTATSPRIREILSLDGGLERLVRILKGCAAGGGPLMDENLSALKGKGKNLAKGARKSPFKPFSHEPNSVRSKQFLFTYTLAFQCVVNIGVRGSESIRTRVVEAGALHVVVTVLERFLEELVKRKQIAQGKLSAAVPVAIPPVRVSTPDTIISVDDVTAAEDNGSSSGQEAEDLEILASASEPRTRRNSSETTAAQDKLNLGTTSSAVDADGDVVMQENPSSSRSANLPERAQQPPSSNQPTAENVLQYRDEDVLLSLQLLAYLSKYAHVRTIFHSNATPNSPATTNIFSLVEQFTHRPSSSDVTAPRHSSEVQYWAGVIMRNACRKDESRGGIRQCANMSCGKWENFAREFAKCRRCRKAKYCSKNCQSTAWQFGHRYWCNKATPKETTSGAQHTHSHAPSATTFNARRSRDEEDELEEDLEFPALPPNRTQSRQFSAAGGGVVTGATNQPPPIELDENEIVNRLMAGGVLSGNGTTAEV